MNHRAQYKIDIINQIVNKLSNNLKSNNILVKQVGRYLHLLKYESNEL